MSSSTVLTPARTSSEDSIQAAKRTVQPFNRRSGSSRSDLDSSVSSVSDPREEEPQKFKRLSTKSGLVVYDRNIEDSGKRHLPSLLPLATAAPARRFLDEATMQSPVSASPTSPKKPTQHHSHADTKLNSWQYFDDDDDAFFKLMQSRAKEIVPAVDTNPFKKEPTFVRERVEMERSFSELQRRSVALVEPERSVDWTSYHHLLQQPFPATRQPFTASATASATTTNIVCSQTTRNVVDGTSLVLDAAARAHNHICYECALYASRTTHRQLVPPTSTRMVLSRCTRPVQNFPTLRKRASPLQ
jgi:hypothetical protein